MERILPFFNGEFRIHHVEGRFGVGSPLFPSRVPRPLGQASNMDAPTLVGQFNTEAGEPPAVGDSIQDWCRGARVNSLRRVVA